MRSLFVFFLITPGFIYAQVPFGHKTKFRDETPAQFQRKAIRQGLDTVFIKHVKTSKAVNLSASNPAADAQTVDATNFYNRKQLEAERKSTVLDQFSGTLVIPVDEVAQLFPTISGDVITYRLRMWTTIKNGVTTRHYLPISIISKVSASQKNNTGTVNDAVSFFGSPFTFRLSPTIVDVPWGDTRFVLGMHHDARLLMIGDTLTNKIQAGFGYYGAVGVSFFGEGDVMNTGDPTRYEGTWSFSALLYHFSSGGKFDKTVFGNYEPKDLNGFEAFLRFKTSDQAASRFNLFLGAGYGFTKNAPDYNKWTFKIGMGN